MISDQIIKADQVIAISSGEDARLLRKTALGRGYTFPIIADHYGTISAAYGVKVTPTVAFKNEAGELERVSSGISPLLSYHVRNFLKSHNPSNK